MSDFSQYGGIAPEWDILMESKPQVAPPPDITPIELRRLTNETREQAARILIKGVGRRILIQWSSIE